MAGGAVRQRMALSDQLSLIQPSNLRDLLKVRNDDISSSVSAVPSRSRAVTLAAVLAADENSPVGRTLLDVIRDEEETRNSGGSSSWRELTDRLRIRHAAAASATWTAGSASSVDRAAEDGSGAVTTIRLSLMTLMELRDREEDAEPEEKEASVADVAAAATVEEDEDNDDVAWERRHVCCVCMERKKGAAFIPCGHTFCRICSRELLVSRGNCPLCNAAIAQVLDIF